jgi:ubiquinone/menaquinone biosynthesis C-methylase UbiE
MKNISDNAIFDNLAPDYDSWSFTDAGKIVYQLELNALLQALKLEKDCQILDIGVGTGIFSAELVKRGAIVVGIDPSEEMLSIAKQRGINEIVKGNGENLPFADEQFDIVLAFTSLEFSPNPQRFVSEMYRVCKPQGQIVVAVLTKWSMYGIARSISRLFRKSIFRHTKFYTYSSLNKLLNPYVSNINYLSTVFINPKPPKFILKQVKKIEKFGQKFFNKNGALLMMWGEKK